MSNARIPKMILHGWSKRISIARFLALGAALFFLLAVSAAAQTTPPPKAKTSHGRYATMRGTVQVFTLRAITVRDAKNLNLIRTFSFVPKLFKKMQKRRYKWGQRVKVKYYRGTDIAVSVK